MKPTQSSHLIQQTTTGAELFVHSFTYTGSQPGPSIYLQGNLHGPEIFGTVLLQRLMQELEKKEDIPGTLIIVPNANPMGVQTVGYNTIQGRWNAQTGTNWNRIFPYNTDWENTDAYNAHAAVVLADINASIEERLAATLLQLSTQAQYVIDIHTTGSANQSHLFTNAAGSAVFAALSSPVHLLWTAADSAGTFDEANVLPYEKAIAAGTQAPRYAGTWEVHHHNDLSEAVIEQRLAELLAWCEQLWNAAPETLTATQATTPVTTYPVTASSHLTAPAAGYIVWHKNVGDAVSAGEAYATAYQPWNQKSIELKNEKAFHLIGIYGTQAVSQGDQIAWIAYTE